MAREQKSHQTDVSPVHLIWALLRPRVRNAVGETPVVLSPIAIDVVSRIDALVDIKRPINAATAEERRAGREALSKLLDDEFHVYIREQRSYTRPLRAGVQKLSRRWGRCGE